MYTDEILELVMKQKGNLTVDQYLAIYDNTPQMINVILDECADYWFEMWFNDKEEPILFNVVEKI